MQPPLLDPRNDLVFKCLFAHSKPLLTDLTNAVLHPSPPLEVVEILNPQVNLQHVHDKFIVLDILARAADGRLLNVEMQMQQREAWSQRGIYYLAKTLVGQLKAGAPYADLQAVFGIHFLAYDLFPEEDQAQWCFEPRNGGWTGASGQFISSLARRDDDADCILLGGATTPGGRETSNCVCSALNKWQIAFSPNFPAKIKCF